MSLPRIWRRSARDRRARSRPSKREPVRAHPGGPGQQAHDREHADALARAGLAHDRDDLALIDREIDAVDRLEGAVQGRELDREIADLEQRHRALLRLRCGPTRLATLGLDPRRPRPPARSGSSYLLAHAAAEGRATAQRLRPEGPAESRARSRSHRRHPATPCPADQSRATRSAVAIAAFQSRAAGGDLIPASAARSRCICSSW